MLLKGSCHCGVVHFSVKSFTPYPFMYCYCSICRKTAGGAGAAINIMGEAKSLKVTGAKNVGIYRARMSKRRNAKISNARRHFCKKCASALWIFDPDWPQWIYPFASAIDSKLPVPKERVHIMLNYVANWCDVPDGEHEIHFAEYPKESIEEWHRRHGVYGSKSKK